MTDIKQTAIYKSLAKAVRKEDHAQLARMLVRNARKEVRSHFNQPCQRNPHGPLAPAGPHVRKESH